MSSHIDAFVLACRARGLAPGTVAWYRATLERLARYASGRRVTLDLLRQFIVDAQTRGCAPATVRGYVRAFKVFFRWCIDEECLRDDPARRLDLPRLPRQIPRGITREDFHALVSCASARDRAVLYFLADTGCRAAELRDVCLGDMKNDLVLVRGKGNQERFLFLSDETRRHLAAWLGVRVSASEFLFVTDEGRPFTYATLRALLRRLKERAGVRGRCNPHSFRHGFAREWLMSGGDLASLSDVLGHRDIVTTRIYAAFAHNDLRAKHARHSALVLAADR